MMFMGDEYGHTRYGNNNSYGHDDALNNFQWKQVCDMFLYIFPCLLQYNITNEQITTVGI